MIEKRSDGCATVNGQPNCAHRLLFSAWGHCGELSECLHHADSGRLVDRFAGVAVPAMQNADQAVRQRACFRMVVAPGEMPIVRVANLSDVPFD